VIAFEVDLMYVNHTSKLKFATNNLQNDIVVKYRVYEIQLMSLNFKYILDITVCSNFNSYKSLRITACTQKHKSFTDSIASYPKFPWVKDLVFLRTINFVAIAWGCLMTTDIQGVSKKTQPRNFLRNHFAILKHKRF
jgi:hypothetical protein